MIFDYKSSEEMLKYHVSTQNCEPILNDCEARTRQLI